MSMALPVHGRVVLCVILGGITAEIGIGGCDIELPCPAQCFAYTVEYALPRECKTAGVDIQVPFTAPSGYHGRHCLNSPSASLAMDAIDHLRAGGQLSELALNVQTAYISIVDSVRADIQAECITAAPGQCLNEGQVCTGIAADAYVQLVVDETCVLEPDGTQPISLGPGEACEASAVGEATGSADTGDHCTETTIGLGDSSLDGTAGSGAVDGTSG